MLEFTLTKQGKSNYNIHLMHGPEETVRFVLGDELYPGRYTFVFDQGRVTKNQPVTVLVLLCESLGI